jgi:hypothetical protein
VGDDRGAEICAKGVQRDKSEEWLIGQKVNRLIR